MDMGVQRLPSQYSSAFGTLPSSNEGQGNFALGASAVTGARNSFDSFELARTRPNVKVSPGGILAQVVFHPFETLTLLRKLRKGSRASGEGLLGRITMYRTLKKNLGRSDRKQLKELLKDGVLANTGAENSHSTLYHLYAIQTTRRASGLENRKVLAETVNLLNKPFAITQKFAPLTEQASKELLSIRNNPGGLNRAGIAPAIQPITWQDIDVKNSATCVSSSVMYYMADKNPSELARHLNELTSPMLAFQERGKLSEISPNDPQKAFEILDAYHIKYHRSGPDEVTVKVELPPAGHVRMVNASNIKRKPNVHTGIESAYQSALSFMATARSYDPATDDQASEIGGQRSPGLTEEQKTIMETIIKDNGGVMSVTYQVAAGKANPKPNEEGIPYLYGYTRTFEQTTADIIESLKGGEFVIIGITDTSADGAIIGGHEITITSAFADRDGEIKFVVFDSDDDVPTPVVRTARELVPRIHHAGMPLKLAQKIQGEIQQNPGYFVPSQEDTQHYTPISQTPDILPADAFGTPAEQVPQQPTQQTSASAPSPQPVRTAPIEQAKPQVGPVIEYVPVYSMPSYGPAYYGYPYGPYPMPTGYGYPPAYGYAPPPNYVYRGY